MPHAGTSWISATPIGCVCRVQSQSCGGNSGAATSWSNGRLAFLRRPLRRSLGRPLAAARGLARYLRALLPRLVERDGDRLLAALHFPSGAALERALLAAVHRRLDVLLRRLAVLGHRSSLS